MPRQREWTERDVNILYELYKVREMTKQQIVQSYFEGNLKYGNRRLYMLRDEGLVTSGVHGGNGQGGKRVRTAYYRLTERGLELLRKKGVVEESKYRARDLELTVQQRQYIIDANELHIRLPDVIYMDSRAIKRKYNLNRGNLTVGGFNNEKGDFMIFILNGDAKEQTLQKILMEIGAKEHVSGYLVYYKSESVKRAFESLCDKQGLVTGGVPLYLLPFDDLGIGVTQYGILSTNAFLNLQELLSEYGQLTKVKDGKNKYGFLYGMRRDDGLPTPYVIEIITGNILILKRCLRNYNVDAHQREGRKVLLFCYEDEVSWYKQELLSAAHVDIVGISKNAFESNFEGGML
ncbi:hypothetical protein ASL14_19130 [Paenibacillus sp. IHB B 3084]|uniref:replication-relaxation family protein n=1 Tax=Paenibacillus sp. IHB B 3084 TaxID=867076 RepID=UPI0007205979|nr:replication-relaxation family protein [Paenibacillus sp. IHB B 3084]ALP37986.1 hypothetical protein ASL14_19130 [Paenibacillus sp. IHB B 3084]